MRVGVILCTYPRILIIYSGRIDGQIIWRGDTEQQIEESIQLLWTSHETVEALLFVCRVPSIGRVQVLTDPCMHDSVYLPVLEETDVR